MKAFVLDASTARGWMPDRPVPAGPSQDCNLILAGGTPVMPTLWRHEVSKAIVMVERRGRLDANQVKTLTCNIDEFLPAVDVDSLLVRASVLIETAQRTHLTRYNAAYLELASRRRLPLATLDNKLREAARVGGLALV